ncbi:MAG: hypothetical protein ACLP50_37280 [Solirubrobacteraceae bacterium]
MDRETLSSTQYKPVTVDVPEDRVAEFHALFARFLGGPRGRRRGGRHGGPHGGRHGGHEIRCARRSETAERSEPTPAASEI